MTVFNKLVLTLSISAMLLIAGTVSVMNKQDLPFVEEGKCFIIKNDDGMLIKMFVVANRDHQSFLYVEVAPNVMLPGTMTYSAIRRHQPVKVPCHEKAI